MSSKVGLVDFPNLAFETTSVEFGSCLSDTTRRVPVQITNTANVTVVYSWAWDAESLQEDANSMASFSMKAPSAKAASKPPAVQLFDILPIKGSLRPGESEVVNFSFFAYPGVKASAVAMCQVEGGPTYHVSCADCSLCPPAALLLPSLAPLAAFSRPPCLLPSCAAFPPPSRNVSTLFSVYVSTSLFRAGPCGLPQVNMSGESNYIKYTVEPQSIDVGSQPFDKATERELVINNQGKVPFDFHVNTRMLQRLGSVEPLPRKGSIGPGQKGTIRLKVGMSMRLMS